MFFLIIFLLQPSQHSQQPSSDAAVAVNGQENVQRPLPSEHVSAVIVAMNEALRNNSSASGLGSTEDARSASPVDVVVSETTAIQTRTGVQPTVRWFDSAVEPVNEISTPSHNSGSTTGNSTGTSFSANSPDINTGMQSVLHIVRRYDLSA